MSLAGHNVEVSSTKDAAIVSVMKRLAENHPGDHEMERKVIYVLRVLPSVLSLENVVDAKAMLESYFQDWSKADVHSVATLVYKRECGSAQRQPAGTSFQSTATCFEKGECAKASAVDKSLPESLQVEEAVRKLQWDEFLTKPDQLVAHLVEHLKFNNSNFDLISTSCAEHLCVSLIPCAILKFRDLPLSYLTAGALLKFYVSVNESSSSCYDDSLCVGELMLEGEAFLKNSGPERHSIVLGVTDMKMIQWFRITRSTSHLKVAKGLATSDVIESIYGFLYAKPSVLGVKVSLAINKLPSSWRIVKHLGSGLTSHVYLVVSASRTLAVKVPRLGFDLSEDIRSLEVLASVDGVPKIHQKINSMIALEPVGNLFSRETLGEYEAKGSRLSLADLVVILECAHQRGIVNRDVRSDNIMIGESMHNAGKLRLYILDWGFATKSNEASGFCGSVVTASDLVLEQLSQQKQCVLTRVVVSPNDDLVSLVRCLFLTFHFQFNAELQQICEDPDKIRAFWKHQMECNIVWRKAEEDALHLRYDSLKKFFSCVPEI